MKRQQCFTCYDHALFQLYGQGVEYNPARIAQDYVRWLEMDNEVSCITCGRKIQYKRNTEGIWMEHEI